MSFESIQRSELAQILGAGVGEIFYLVDDTASSDLYYALLKKRGIRDSKIFSTLLAAEDQMASDQNDTLLVYPGDHAQTASLTWDKDATNIVGVGSPNQFFQPSTLTNGGVRLTCTTAAVTQLLDITGNYVSLYNFGTFNNGAATTNDSDIKVSGRNFYAEDMAFRGGNTTEQVTDAKAGIPVIIASDIAGAGNAAKFRRCMLGSAGNTARTKGAGCLHLNGGAAAGFAIEFENCRFTQKTETASGDDVSMINIAAQYGVDRYLLLKDCLVYNFWTNSPPSANVLTAVINDEATTTHTNIIMNSFAYGFTYWTNVAAYTYCSSPAGDGHGGIGVLSHIA
jgi:hypothetical protein